MSAGLLAALISQIMKETGFWSEHSKYSESHLKRTDVENKSLHVGSLLYDAKQCLSNYRRCATIAQVTRALDSLSYYGLAIKAVLEVASAPLS